MGELVEFARPDGKSCPGYLSLPAAGAESPAIVVIQEWWGLNPQIKKTADRFAEQGYRALVPDLFRGKLAKDADEAGHMMGNLDFIDAAGQDVRGAVQHLKQYAPGKKVAVGGFCMGGALTILAGLKVPEMDAGACFYGIPPAAAGDAAEIKVPMILHFASQDDWCTRPAISALEDRLKAGGVNYTLHMYDAQHAFMNEARPEVYSPDNAKLAWERTLEFLKANLG